MKNEIGGHAARMVKKISNIYNIVRKKTEEKGTLGRPRCRWGIIPTCNLYWGETAIKYRVVGLRPLGCWNREFEPR
jgi:hypothetical protein